MVLTGPPTWAELYPRPPVAGVRSEEVRVPRAGDDGEERVKREKKGQRLRGAWLESRSAC